MAEDIDEVLRNMGGSAISNIYSKMARAIRNQHGVHFSASEMDWLTVIGGYANVLQAVADEAFEASVKRLTAQGHDVSHFPRPGIGTFRGPPKLTDAEINDAADLKAQLAGAREGKR